MKYALKLCRCEYCGRFIPWRALNAKRGADRAAHYMVTSGSDRSVKEWTTYHAACERRAAKLRYK